MSAVSTSPTELLYFGKVPSRGDFVRSAQHASLITSLDKWQSQTMDRLAADPRWKLVYDAAPATQFAILGTGSSVGLAGHWLASQDASGRRFPFITAGAFDLPQPRDFVTVGPLALSRLWARLEQVARVAHAAVELEHAQASLNGPLDVDVNLASAQRSFEDFLDTHTVASLEQMLAANGTRISIRQATLAMGMLLQPAMAQGAAKLSKVLCLPLVSDVAMRGAVASWWLSLIMGFFSRHAVELGLFLTTLDGRPYLVVGFQGASAATLHAVVDQALLGEQGVNLLDAEWVEDEVDADYGLRKLSNYLRDPGLSLAQALSTYREVFLGE
ncbi:MAG: type VI secretion system-associated protein TagF [Aquabacterium sp.]|uniref:type VI secretion system-associated protein TagF n=1 Tax=Aquabacterium sp. TaxID=1872578 RepID=UPI0025C6D7EE|nr:type VI secretion system-associated protein TagF [Aquabacterium sp.]MBI5925224.1 type VI secretion system-associated protein TagF [Aquabacterium sp.]